MSNWATAVVLAAAALTALAVLVRSYMSFTRRFIELADDLLGRDGHPSISQRLASIEHELHPNSGLSLRDSVDRTEQLANEAHTAAIALKEQMVENAKVARRRRNEDRALLRQMDKRIAQLAPPPPPRSL